jgi:glycosyltransferase involved in cell wall biosynthesis
VSVSSLLVRGPYKGPSGYDHHVREFVREFCRQGIAVQLVDAPQWGPVKLPTPLQDPWFDTLHRPVHAQTALQFCMPHQVVPFPAHLNVNYTMFEATRIPAAWVRANRRHDLVIVPTESSRCAWVASGFPARRIRLCPLGINRRLFSRRVVPIQRRLTDGSSLAQYRFRFLNVSELGPRKNLTGLLRAWLVATSHQDDAVLIIKLSTGALGSLQFFHHQLTSLQQQVGKRLAEAAPVHFIHDLFSDEEMPGLYAAATHYISMSFGEGWDQSMVEAGASGLRLISPSHSAYTAYLDPSVAQLIPVREVPAEFPGPTGAFFRGARWWEPDHDAAVAAIRAAIEGRDAPRGSAGDRILSEFTWERAARRLISLLDELEMGARSRRPWKRFRLIGPR